MAEPLVHSIATPNTAVSEPLPLETLGHQIAELSAQIQAATYRLLVLIRDFDLRGGWGCGFRSCAHWLNWRTGLELGAAREKVRVARALGDLPLISEGMRHGELSYSKVRALTRVATGAQLRRQISSHRGPGNFESTVPPRIRQGLERIDPRELEPRNPGKPI